MITLSCGVKISAVFSIVSSQSTRMTDGRTESQNYDPQDRAIIAASRGNDRQVGSQVAARAEAFKPGHLTWRALASRRDW